jgi:hypothetical protein
VPDTADGLVTGGHHHAILLIQVKVGARTVLHDVTLVPVDDGIVAGGADWQLVLGQQSQAAGFHKVQAETGHGGAQCHQPVFTVEGQGSALATGDPGYTDPGVHLDISSQWAVTGMHVRTVTVCVHGIQSLPAHIRMGRNGDVHRAGTGRFADKPCGRTLSAFDRPGFVGLSAGEYQQCRREAQDPEKLFHGDSPDNSACHHRHSLLTVN